MADAIAKESQAPTPNASEAPSLGPERPVVRPQRTYRTLPNGLEVVLVESHTVPKFTGELYFRSGNAAAPVPGLAEITATVVRTGTQGGSSRQTEADSRRMGADFGTRAGKWWKGCGSSGPRRHFWAANVCGVCFSGIIRMPSFHPPKSRWKRISAMSCLLYTS